MTDQLHRCGVLFVMMMYVAGCGGGGNAGAPAEDAGGGADVVVVAPPALPEVVADRLDQPFAIAVDDRAVYWTNLGGSVMKADKTTGTLATVAAATPGAVPYFLALDRDDVYFSDSGRGLLLRVAKSGGFVQTLAQGAESASGVAIDDQAVYWADFGYGRTGWVARVAKADGTVTKLWLQAGVTQLALAGRVLYWNGNREVRGLALDAAPGTLPTLVFEGTAPYGLGVAGDRVLVSDYDRDVVMTASGGRPAAPLLRELHGPYQLAADEASVYFSNWRDGTLCRAPLGGGEIEVLAEGQAGIGGIAVDASFIYWTQQGAAGLQDGRVLRLPRTAPGLPVQAGLEVPVRGQRQPVFLASDDGALYWTTRATSQGSGAIMRADKPTLATVATVSGPHAVPVGLAVDDRNVYFADSTPQTLYAADKRGGSARRLAGRTLGEPSISPTMVAVDETSVYWLHRGESATATGWVERVAKDGATSYRVAEMQGGPLDVAVRGSTVAWVNGQGSIARADLAAPAGEYTVILNGGQPNALLLTDDAVVFTDYRQGTLATVSLGGGAARVLAQGLAQPNYLAADEGHFYVTCVGDGTVVAIPRAGGQPRVLAARQDFPQAIAVDGSHVYWVTRGSVSRDSGEIARVRK